MAIHELVENKKFLVLVLFLAPLHTRLGVFSPFLYGPHVIKEAI